MSVEILMPALSPTMEEGTLAKWLKSEGDTVSAGDVIAEIETDKATMEVEAVDEGTLAKIIVPEGTEGVKVNSVIAMLAEEGESADDVEAPDTDAQSATTDDVSDKDEDSGAAEPQDAPKISVSSDPDIPEGTEFEETAIRDALRDAMAEEMRRDETVFVMGEEVAEYQGAYKISQGLLDEFGPKRVIDTPITEHGFAGVGVGAPRITGLAAALGVGGHEIEGVVLAPAYFKLQEGGELRGVSVSAYNDIRGSQNGLAIGIVNIAEELHGLQIGLINIARNKESFPVLPLFNYHP